MLRGLLAAAAFVAVLAFASPVGATGPDDLESIDSVTLSPRLTELTFSTPAVGTTKVRILVPEGFDAGGSVRYPVLFLLHGGTGSFRDWTDDGHAEALTAGFPFIVVMPDATGYGNYADWYNHGDGGPPMWETYHVGQLLPWVDANYPTVGTRDGRAIAGLSMGGGGAVAYAARHPDLFGAVAAFSGAVDTNTIPVQLLVEGSGVPNGRRPGSVYGHRLDNEIRWRGNNGWDLAENLDNMFIQLDTGNGLPGGPAGDLVDPVELAVHEQMTNLHRRLVELGTPHIWNDYGAGGHNWFYWRRDLSELLPRLEELWEQPPAAVVAFDYKSIAASYDVHGWRVEITRPAIEFSQLSVQAGGFSLRGSGDAEVTTPGTFPPGAAVHVTITDADGTREAISTADPSGHVSMAVSLGPGNPEQQHTLEGDLWALAETGTSGAWPSRTALVTFNVADAADDAASPPAPDPSRSTIRGTSPDAGTLPVTAGRDVLPVGLSLAAMALLSMAVRRH